jgi:hypothetical protein
MNRPLNVLPFPGIHTDTLGHYLSGLGLLAAMGQRWADVRGCWRDRRFALLHTSLTEEEVRQYLLAEWQPSRYERWWAKAQVAKSPASVQRERNCRSIQEVCVLEAHLVAAAWIQTNPVFGTGGIRWWVRTVANPRFSWVVEQRPVQNPSEFGTWQRC